MWPAASIQTLEEVQKKTGVNMIIANVIIIIIMSRTHLNNTAERLEHLFNVTS